MITSLRTILKSKYLYFIIAFFLLARIPSLFESFWYGDEAIYAAIGSGLYDGKFLYTEIWDHKPPLILGVYILAFFFDPVIGIVLVKALSIAFGLVAIYYFYKLLKSMSFTTLASLTSLVAFAFLLGTPYIEGNVANSENFFIAFNVALLYLLYEKKHFGLAGAIVFLSLITKIPSFIESCFIILTFFIIYIKENDKQFVFNFIKKILVGFTLPVTILIIYFGLHGAFFDVIDASFLANIGYSSAQDNYTVIFGEKVSSLLLNTAVLFSVVAIATLSYWKGQISKNVFIIVNVLSIEVFATLLSGRNYPHYLIQAIPGMCLFLAMLASSIRKNLYFYNFRLIAIFLMILQIILTTFTRGEELNRYIKLSEYYPRFVLGIVFNNSTEKEAFWWRNGDAVARVKSFSDHFNRNYHDISNYYIYTGEAWLFPLIGKPSTNKFVVWYHLGFKDIYLKQEIANLQKAEIVIIDQKVPANKAITDEIQYYEILEELNEFVIYKKSQ